MNVNHFLLPVSVSVCLLLFFYKIACTLVIFVKESECYWVWVRSHDVDVCGLGVIAFAWSSISDQQMQNVHLFHECRSL